MKKSALVLAVTLIVCLALAVDTGLAGSPQVAEVARYGSEHRLMTAPLSSPGVAPTSYQEQNMTIGRFCFRCHNDTTLTGGMSLESFDVERAYDNAELAEKMIRKLRAGMMPPRQAQQPDEATVAALVTALETTLDEAAAAHPNPGRRTFQRLNQAEYVASVQDLLGITIKVDTF